MKIPDEAYDVAFSLGAACSCTESLRRAGLQFASFPFDWLYGSTFRKRVDLLADDFRGWLDPDLLEPGVRSPTDTMDVYRNRTTGIVFNHDFPPGVPLSAVLPQVREKYARRIQRLTGLIRSAHRVLVVYLNLPAEPYVSDEDLRQCRKALSARYPNATFDVLCFQPDSNLAGVEDREVDRGIRRVSFDFGRHDVPAACAWLVQVPRIVEFLNAYRVHDYRTSREKRLWRWRKMGASNFLSYCRNKFEYKLMKHLRKRLVRHGVPVE